MKLRRQDVVSWVYLLGLALLLVGLVFAITFVAKLLGYQPKGAMRIFPPGALPDPQNTGGPPWALALAVLAFLGGLIWLGRWAMRNADD